MEVRDIEDIKDALKNDQQSRHSGLQDYGDYSVLTTLNEAMGIQVQYVEGRAKEVIENNSVWTASGEYLDILVQDRGIERQEGVRATGTITFRTSTPTLETISIAEGTLVSAVGEDGTQLFFETTVAGTIDVGYTSTTIAAQAVEVGEDGNVPAYSISRMAVYIAGVSRVENTSAFSGGTEEESDDDLRERYIYATDINGKATLPLMEQHIFDLDTVRECQIYTKAPGEIEIVVDSTHVDENDDDVVDCIEENIAAGVVGRGKVLATIDSGVITSNIDTIKSGRLRVRVESTLVTPNESFTLNYTDTLGVSRTASVTIPTGSVKGNTITASMYSLTDLAVQVDGGIYTGSNSYSILGGFGEYPYMYILPKIVYTNVSIGITQTETPDPDLEEKIEASIEAYLDQFYIGDDIEFSDLIPYIYNDFETDEAFVGIDQITSVVITASGTSITGFGQTITINTDQRVEPGTINVVLT